MEEVGDGGCGYGCGLEGMVGCCELVRVWGVGVRRGDEGG